MLHVSLDCPFFIVLSVCSNVYLLHTVCPVSCAQCCTCLWIVHSSLSFRFALKFIYYIQFVLCLLCPMLHVSLDCPFFIVLSVCSKVYLLHTVCPVSCAQCWTCLWIVHSSLFSVCSKVYLLHTVCLCLVNVVHCPFFIVLSVCSKVYLLHTVCPVSCAQCCTCLWIVHSSLSFRFALKFIYYIQFVLCCAQCCMCLWIVHSSLSFRFALKFIYYIQFVLCLVPNVARVSGLSILHCPFGLL